MNCFHCVERVSEVLKNIGAKDVDVSFVKSAATINITSSITDKLIKSAIEGAGYEVLAIEKNQLKLKYRNFNKLH